MKRPAFMAGRFVPWKGKEKMKTVIYFMVLSAIFVGTAFAVPPTLPNEATYFVGPNGWNAGDIYSTYQEWDVFSPSPNPPDETSFYLSNPSGLVSPSLLPESPGFFSSMGFYAFSGNYSFYADIYNYGGLSGAGAPAGYGTHVIIQTLVTLNTDGYEGGDPNNPVGLFADSLRIVDFNDANLPGGSNVEAIRVDRICNLNMASGGHAWDVYGEELIFEFFLPDYTGDFRIRADVVNHGNTKQMRIDTMLVTDAFEITPIPGPRDINDDNQVNLIDCARFSAQWLGVGCSGYEGCDGADFNLDGAVDVNDFVEFIEYWLEGVPIN